MYERNGEEGIVLKEDGVMNLLPTPLAPELNRKKLREEHIRVIEESLRLDSTVEEACILAGISESTFYKYLRNDPQLKVRIERAKNRPKMIARAAVYKRIAQGDAKTALRFLELRDKRYKADATEEFVKDDAPVVQFISVAAENKGQETSHDTQKAIKPKSVSSSSSSFGDSESEKLTPWENEDHLLENLNS